MPEGRGRHGDVWSPQPSTPGSSPFLRATMNHRARKNLPQLTAPPFLLTINTYIDLRKHFRKGAKSCGSEALRIGYLRF